LDPSFATGPSLESLQADYAKQDRIDPDAFIKSHAEIFVNAPVAHVWEILADASNWFAWMPGVRTVRLDSTVAPGATFAWKCGSSTIRSAFAVVQPNEELTWTGISVGAKGLDRHTLQPIDGGRGVSLLSGNSRSHTSLEPVLQQGPRSARTAGFGSD
jgi:uncharacterized protein YndB with AHSA1/START domain